MSARLAARALVVGVTATILVLVLGASAGAEVRGARAGVGKSGGFVAKRTPVRVAFYGDSLASEAQDSFVAAVNGRGRAEVRTGTYGGTAICDWFDQMRRDAAEWRPQAVVVEFSGNALTPCMRGDDGQAFGGDAYYERYQADAAAVVSIFSEVGARVYFASSPISRSAAQAGGYSGGRLNAMYRAVPGSRYVDAAAAVLDPAGRYTDTLPCLPTEPCTGTDGTNVVRAPDGAHFCPGNGPAQAGVTQGCGAWSSGAYRYARAMAAPVIREFGL
jgi:hypothetical protein